MVAIPEAYSNPPISAPQRKELVIDVVSILDVLIFSIELIEP